MSSTFVPPFFCDIGKKLSDHLTKSYKTTQYSFEVTSKSPSGLKIKPVGVFKDGKVSEISLEASGSFKGLAKGKVTANNSGTIGGNVELLKLRKGLTAKVSTKDIKGQNASVDIKYQFPDFASAHINLAQKKKGGQQDITAAVSIGVKGLVTGFSGTFSNFNSGEYKTLRPACFANKTQWDLANISLVLQSSYGEKFDKDSKSVKNVDSFQLGFLHTVNSSLTVGARWIKQENEKVMLELASKKVVDADTTVETKLNCCGQLASVVSKKLSFGKVTVKSELPLDFSSTLAPTKFGVEIDFGEL